MAAVAEDVEVLERDGERRATSVETESDAKVRTIRSRLRFAYDPPTAITWEQERGDVKSLNGWWRLEELGDGRTRATYGLEVDPGRMLGMLLRGPAEGKVRDTWSAGRRRGSRSARRRADAPGGLRVPSLHGRDRANTFKPPEQVTARQGYATRAMPASATPASSASSPKPSTGPSAPVPCSPPRGAVIGAPGEHAAP